MGPGGAAPPLERPPKEGGMQFNITKHARESLEQMNALRTAGKLCDINLRAESDTYPAHRVVLAAASPYFRVSGVVGKCQ